MMKKKFTGAAALGFCLALGISMGASADSRKVVTLELILLTSRNRS